MCCRWSKTPKLVRSSNRLAPSSALLSTSQHSSRIHSYIAPQHSQCISTSTSSPSVYCITQWARYFPSPCSALLHTCLTTRSRCRLCNRVPRAPFSPLFCAVVHLVRYCHTSCSTTHCLADVDWLTCGISSAATTAASGFGEPFLFGTRMHRSNRRAYACTS